jgi:hypothetical protein
LRQAATWRKVQVFVSLDARDQLDRLVQLIEVTARAVEVKQSARRSRRPTIGRLRCNRSGMYGSPQGVRQLSLGGGPKSERRAHTSCRGALFWVATKALAMTELPAIPPSCRPGSPVFAILGQDRVGWAPSVDLAKAAPTFGVACRLPAFFTILALARLATNSPEDGARHPSIT